MPPQKASEAAQKTSYLTHFSRFGILCIFEHLAHSYIFDPYSTTLALQQHTSFSLLHVSRLVKIDVIPPSTIFERTLLKRGQAHMLIETREPLLIVSAEDITLLNLIQYQAQGNNADDRWNDILRILKIQALTLNLAYLDQQAKEMGVDELLSQALIDAGIHGEEPSSSFQKEASVL